MFTAQHHAKIVEETDNFEKLLFPKNYVVMNTELVAQFVAQAMSNILPPLPDEVQSLIQSRRSKKNQTKSRNKPSKQRRSGRKRKIEELTEDQSKSNNPITLLNLFQNADHFSLAMLIQYPDFHEAALQLLEEFSTIDEDAIEILLDSLPDVIRSDGPEKCWNHATSIYFRLFDKNPEFVKLMNQERVSKFVKVIKSFAENERDDFAMQLMNSLLYNITKKEVSILLNQDLFEVSMSMAKNHIAPLLFCDVLAKLMQFIHSGTLKKN